MLKISLPIAVFIVAAAATSTIGATSGNVPIQFRPAAQLQLPYALVHRVKFSYYSVVDLGTLGGSFSGGAGVNSDGFVNGYATRPDGTQRAFVWHDGVMIGLGTLGGPNSSSGWLLNDSGWVAGWAETANRDPNGEDFCLFGTHLTCVGVLWRNGVIRALPTLGGNYSAAAQASDQGWVVGVAETAVHDPTCTVPQVLGYLPVIWRGGLIQRVLPTWRGDSAGVAISINDKGETVGYSSGCGAGPLQTFNHALLWRYGRAINLGSLGGTNGNFAYNISNESQVVGLSDLPGDVNQHGFLWEDGRMRDLGTLPGDSNSEAQGIGDDGLVIGTSYDSAGNGRAYVWRAGAITDMNLLIPASSPLYLIQAAGINARGQITGLAFVKSTGEIHAFLATPCEEGRRFSYCDDVTQGLSPVDERRFSLQARMALQQLAHNRPGVGLFGGGSVQLHQEHSNKKPRGLGPVWMPGLR